jgi:transglutaminase-like putative cysteine protease
MNYRLTFAAAVGTVLASTALYALFVGMEWFWAGVGAVIVVAAVGLATRIRRLPVAVCVLAGLAGLLLYLNLLFAPGQSWFAIIPNAASLTHVWHVAVSGTTDADRFSPPVPITTGLLLLSTAGIGLAAVAADVLAARVRSSAVAGLPLLALFIAPSTTPAARSGWGTALVFFLATAGYLLILAADGRDRIGRWGRTVGLWRADRYGRPDTNTGRTPGPGSVKTSDVSTLASAGRRIGMISIVVALCVPLFIPGLQANRMFPAHVNVFGHSGTGLGDGSGGIGPDPLAQMAQDLHEGQPESVLTYTTTDPEPQYLQMYVLSQLTTTQWKLEPHVNADGSASGTLPTAQGETQASKSAITNQTTHITFSEAASKDAPLAFLPLPYPTTKVKVAGKWAVNDDTGMVFGFNNSLSGLSYSVTSQDLEPTAQQLAQAGSPAAAISNQFLNVPPAFRSLTTLADKVTKSATNPYSKALALQNWFTDTGKFTYSLEVREPVDATGLTHFLTVTKKGYCQQFAFAMAVLARLLGIPSRVAVGFTPGTATGVLNTYQVKTSDAHAWPELYFQGLGWIRFEPTPSGSGGQGTAVPPTYTIPQIADNSGGGSSSSSSGSNQSGGNSGTKNKNGNDAKNQHLSQEGTDSGGSGSKAKHGSFPLEPIGLALAALLAVAIIAPPASRFLVRQRRLAYADDLERAHAVWRETLDELADYHVARRPSESPRAVARRVTADAPLAAPAAEALGRVALAEERASYADTPGATPTRADLELIRHGLAVSATRRARWRARLTPASVYVPLRNLSGWVSGAATQAQSNVRRHRSGARSRLNQPSDHDLD